MDPSESRLGIRLLGIVVVLLACVVLFEAACQAYARLVVFRRFDHLMARSRHYYQASPSPLLAYELRPGLELENDGKLLRISRYGIRATDDDIATDQWRLAVLLHSQVVVVGDRQMLPHPNTVTSP